MVSYISHTVPSHLADLATTLIQQQHTSLASAARHLLGAAPSAADSSFAHCSSAAACVQLQPDHFTRSLFPSQSLVDRTMASPDSTEAFTDFLSVSAGAVIGAAVRYYVLLYGKAIKPWPTFIVNLFGTLVLGLLYGLGSAANSKTVLFVGTGFCGSLTTFSTFALEALNLFKAKDYTQFFLYVVLTVVVGILTAALGFFIGTNCVKHSASDEPSTV